jgi:DNA-binding LacI/PurR family transcriptional regulator
MSIQRIAKLAGVPYSTTWRAINQVPGVSDEAAAAVRKAMEQIGYTHAADRPRRGLDSNGRKRHRNVAMLDLRENTTLSISILRTVQRILIEQGSNLVFGHVSGPDDLPPAVVRGEVDGILGYGEFPPSAITPRIKQIPAVWMMSQTDYPNDEWGDRIMADHRAIGQLAARYLIDQGHRHLAFFNTAPTYPFFCERGQGFESTAAAAGGKVDSVHLLSSDSETRASSPAAMQQVIEQWSALSPRPTGLFIPTDSTSVAIYRILIGRGIRPGPGRDVQIISCDNRDDQLALMDPPPVSIDLNREIIARLAVERLLWRMREGLGEPPVRIVVGPRLNGLLG